MNLQQSARISGRPPGELGAGLDSRKSRMGRASAISDSFAEVMALIRGLQAPPRKQLWYSAWMLSVGLRSGGYGEDELLRAGAFRVFRDASELHKYLDELGVLS